MPPYATADCPHEPLRGQTLLIDADDTLWENNVYFEQAIAAFISYLDHRVHTPAEVREHLNGCERATIARFGYGLASFRRSLVQCFEALAAEPLTPEKHRRIVGFTEVVADHAIELLPGVEDTLRALASRHRLLLVTKGSEVEQKAKLHRSGLSTYFAAVEVPAEKNHATYTDLITRYRLDTAKSWMIGNSPRSDVNPALAAGLNAVYIPHRSTWVLERDELGEPVTGRQRLQMAAFGDLTVRF